MICYSGISAADDLVLIAIIIIMNSGISVESDSDVVGEPDHGHAGVARTRNRAAHRRNAESETVRADETADQSDDDEEHHRTLHLPAGCNFHDSFCRYVVRNKHLKLPGTWLHN